MQLRVSHMVYIIMHRTSPHRKRSPLDKNVARNKISKGHIPLFQPAANLVENHGFRPAFGPLFDKFVRVCNMLSTSFRLFRRKHGREPAASISTCGPVLRVEGNFPDGGNMSGEISKKEMSRGMSYTLEAACTTHCATQAAVVALHYITKTSRIT